MATNSKKKTAAKDVTGNAEPISISIATPARVEPPELLAPVVREFGLELADSKVDSHLNTFLPFVKTLVDLEPELNELLTGEITPELSEKAKELRKKYRDVRTGSNDTKASEKRDFIVEGRFLDKVDNTITEAAKSKEKKCEEIEKHLENLENGRKAKLKADRKAELEAVGYDSEFIPLDTMEEESYQRLLLKARETQEDKQAAAELRAIKEKQEKEEAEKKKAHIQRFADRTNNLNIIGFRYDESARLFRSDFGVIDVDLVEFDDSGTYLKLYNHALNKYNVAKAEKEEALRLEREAAQRQTNRINVITGLGLTYDTASECYKGFGQVFALTEVVNLSADDFKERYDFVKKKVSDAKAEEKRKEDEQAERLRQTEDQNKKLVQEQKDREDKERKDKEAKDLAQRNAALAPDKEKINAMYLAIKSIQVPNFSGAETQVIGKTVAESLTTLLKWIREEAGKIK